MRRARSISRPSRFWLGRSLIGILSLVRGPYRKRQRRGDGGRRIFFGPQSSVFSPSRQRPTEEDVRFARDCDIAARPSAATKHEILNLKSQTEVIAHRADRDRDRHSTLTSAPTRRVSPTVPPQVRENLDVNHLADRVTALDSVSGPLRLTGPL